MDICAVNCECDFEDSLLFLCDKYDRLHDTLNDTSYDTSCNVYNPDKTIICTISLSDAITYAIKSKRKRIYIMNDLVKICSKLDLITSVRNCCTICNVKYVLPTSDNNILFDINGKYYSYKLAHDNLKTIITRILNQPRIASIKKEGQKFATRSIYNVFIEYDLSNNMIPISTLRRQAIRHIFWELMWFINGRTDLEYLHNHGVHVWDANVKAFAETRKNNNPVFNDVGPTYGRHWRNFGDTGFDQLSYICNSFENRQYDRRLVLSSWAPPHIFDACLPPCHILYIFNVETSGNKHILHCLVTQRSSDVVLALNWNIVSTCLLVHMMCKTYGFLPGRVSYSIANAHIYENQELAANELLNREPRFNPHIDIKSVKKLTDYTWDDINVINYHPHPSVNIGEMAI